MKTFKTIIGVLLLYGAGREFMSAGKQLDHYYNAGVLTGLLLIVLLAAWLIGSSFSEQKLKFKSLAFLKYVAISLALFALFAMFSLAKKEAPSDFVMIHGIKVPMGKCIEGNRKIIPDIAERRTYCTCFAEKVLNDAALRSKYGEQLADDNFLEVISAIQKTPAFAEIGFEKCIQSVKMIWTAKIAQSIKNTWKKELAGTEFESTHNIDVYCDCMIREYRKYPLHKAMEDEFLEGPKAAEIDELCTNEAEINK